MTHLATAAATADITPRWLVEGFAEYVANLHTGQPVAAAAAELRAAVRAGRLPTNLPATPRSPRAGRRLAEQYEQSWLACRLIAARAGAGRAAALLPCASARRSPRVPKPSPRRSGRCCTRRSAAFTAQWRAYLESELR